MSVLVWVLLLVGVGCGAWFLYFATQPRTPERLRFARWMLALTVLVFVGLVLDLILLAT